MTEMLLKAAAGTVCSLEVLDDVVEQGVDGQTKLVQSKSALGDNPVTDKAISLWKTLNNWRGLVERKLVDPAKTIFELYVSRPVTGEIVALFHAAQNNSDAIDALKYARNQLWGKGPKWELRKDLRSDLSKFVNEFLEAQDSELAPIICGFRLTCGSGSPQNDVESIIRGHPVSQSKVRTIADHMCGWVKRRVDELLEKGEPAYIQRDDFHTTYVSFCRAIDRESILKSLSRSPSREQVIERLPDVFVRQLELIEMPFEDQLSSISDFLKACSDRAIWAQSGEVDESSFDELDQTLQSSWQNYKLINNIEHKTKSVLERGQLLLSKCMMHQANVQGMQAPDHFIPGCFHRLSDAQDVGWHSDYRNLLNAPVVA